MALKWWLRWLRTHVPRSIPVCLSDWQTVVSHSDGEGSGGVGVAAWHPPSGAPKAAFLVVPSVLRRLWASQTSKTSATRHFRSGRCWSAHIVAHVARTVLVGFLRLHFSDSASAQAALTKGSSSVQSGDAIAALTWEHTARLNCLPRFDRVASSSNPADGLSRCHFHGPWKTC